MKKEKGRRDMGFRKILVVSSSVLMLFLMLSTVLSQVVHYSGLPKSERFLYKAYPGAAPEVIVDEFIGGTTDWIGGPGRADLLDRVAPYGKTYMNVMAEFGFMPINCREYKGDGTPNLPLNDSSFRVALSYIYGMDDKDADIYGYIGGPWVFALGNVVPPAQTPWYDETIQMPAYTDYDAAWAILQEAGYYIDPDTGALMNPNGVPVRDMTVMYSTGALFWEQGPGMGFVRNFNEFIAYIGATSPRLTLLPTDFITLVYDLLLYHNYDFICIGLTGLGRFVDWLYDVLHSDNIGPWGWNFVGIVDPDIDRDTEIILTSLDVDEVIEAARRVQAKFVYELLPWFPMSTGMDITTVAAGEHPSGELFNVVPMSVYGPENDWTWMALHWGGEPGIVWPGGDIKRALGDAPSNLNPYYEDTLYGWQMLDRAITGLMGVAPLGGDPGNFVDYPWIAIDWKIEHWTSIPELGIVNGSLATFYLRQDVLWHDLTPLTAYDCVENMLFMAEVKPGRYSSVWANLVYSEADGPYKFTAYFYRPSLYYIYYVAGTALLSPKHIIETLMEKVETGEIEDPRLWLPAAMTYEEFTGNPPPEQYPFLKAVVGCGPYVFNFYDEATATGEVNRFHEFFGNAPALGAVVGEWRIDPDTPYTYKVLVQNLLATENVAGGEMTNITVNVKIYEDDVLKYEESDIFLVAFNFTYLGPYTTDLMPAGLHTIRVEVYDSETGDLIHTYEHKYAVTLRADVTTYSGDALDFRVDILDVARAARAFGSMPGHPRWDPPCDTNEDFKVNILDIAAIARNFGWSA